MAEEERITMEDPFDQIEHSVAEEEESAVTETEEEEATSKKPQAKPEDTDPKNGLSSSDVEARLRKFGKNQLPEEKVNHLMKFLAFFVGPIEMLMEGAGILALGLEDWIDAGIIAVILLLNAFVGFFQEFQAGGVINQLKSTLAPGANVVRDGKEIEILAKELVPGDLIHIREGDVIPADAVLIGSDAFLQCDQSSLTGESLPVSKREGDNLFSSCPVKRGNSYAVVTCTGSKTFIGRSAKLVNEAVGVSHFRQVLNVIAQFLLFLDVLFVFIMFIQGYYRGEQLYPQILELTMVLTVVAVPIALPAVTTTTLAVGASILAKKKAIVTRLTAIESLAGVDILCSDKTGTLTKNKLKVNDPFCLQGRTSHELFFACAIASSCLHALNEIREGKRSSAKITEGMDAIDKAIFNSLSTYNVDKRKLAQLKTVEYNPFDPVTKYVYSVVEDLTGLKIAACKGAVHNVLNMVERENGAPYDSHVKAEYNKSVEEFASRGFRSLGVALKPDADGPWILVGILPLFDPPRDDSAATIATAKNLGVSVKMLTGDQLAIAKETGYQLNMGTNMFDACNLDGSGMSGAELADYIENADGFAGVFPEHKYRVVEILQGRKHLVAMTGDGVNDAPALKKADVGIAVEGASEVARAAASIVFLAPGLGVVIDAMKTSRQIFNRMYGYAEYRIAISLQMVIYLTLHQLIFSTIINPTLVIFIALFADIAVLTIAYDRAETSQEPVQWNLRKLIFRSFFISIFLIAGAFITRTFVLVSPTWNNSWEPITFLELVLSQNWVIFSTRTHAAAFYRFLPSPPLIAAVFAVDIISSCFAGFGWFLSEGQNPISIVEIVEIWIFCIGVFVVIDVSQRMLTKWKWLDEVLTHGSSNSELLRERRKLEDLAFRLEILSRTQGTSILDEESRSKQVARTGSQDGLKSMSGGTSRKPLSRTPSQSTLKGNPQDNH
jgi:H+-transporting ATPase